MIDDSRNEKRPALEEIRVEENKYGTVRVNGKTEREMLREFRGKYGDERYSKLKKRLEKYQNK